MVARDRDADGSSANGLEERTYVIRDANFNVTALVGDTDSGTAGNQWGVVGRFTYDPYGSAYAVALGGGGAITLTAAESTAWVSSLDWRHLHQGGEFDTFTGLYHFRNRDYDPVLGRWISQDPAGYVDGANLYGYLLANPTKFLDSQGTEVLDMVWQVGPLDTIDAAGKDLPWATTANEALSFGKRMEKKYNANGCYAPEEIANAMRHAYWQALLTMSQGPASAEAVGNIHEYNAPDFIDSRADLRNNAKGREIGRRATNEEDARYLVEAAFNRGELYGWGPTDRKLLDPKPCGCKPKAGPQPGRGPSSENYYHRGSDESDV